jgi:nucleoside-diphosphate-sugar epimerase
MKALVTGGAGFIGSHLVRALIELGHEVRVLDDLSSGRLEDLHTRADFVKGDVADIRVMSHIVDGIDVVFHQAAHRAVLKSVEDPLSTDLANTHGTLTVLKASLDAQVGRVVAASSSSVYGGAEQLPTPESAQPNPRSPYAVSKLAGELYCRVFAEHYGLDTISLRYFNVYGPSQRPDSRYSAVIPLFIEALRSGESPTVHGDGKQSRDFTFVEDIVAANLAAGIAPRETCRGIAFNIGGGKPHSLLELLESLGALIGGMVVPRHTDPRAGDVRHSYADISKASRSLGFTHKIGLQEGLRRTVAWFTNESVSANRDMIR